MKYIRKFESNKNITYFNKNITYFNIQEILDDLVSVEYSASGFSEVENYSITFVDYMKEIVVGRNVRFLTINRDKKDQLINGVVQDVSKFAYRPEEIYASFMVNDNWYLVSGFVPIAVFDWEPGPLFKQLPLEKVAKKYNL